MIREEKGFTMVELLITMVIFIFVMAAASQIFSGLLTQFKQQSKIAETNIEGVAGLEILRQDIENAGYALPWNVAEINDIDDDGNVWEHLAGYGESSVGGFSTTCNDASRNIDGDTYIGEAPRGICQVNNAGFNGSDYLVIKAMNVANNETDRKWTYLHVGNVKTVWTPDCENLNKIPAFTTSCQTSNDVRVIVVSPGFNQTNSRSLVVSSGAFFTNFDNTSAFAPGDNTETHILYGVDPVTDLRMPFNRTDYYIRSSNVPQRCASNTGVLVKAVVSHDDGDFDQPPDDDVQDELPLIDCVADFQVVFGVDTDTLVDGTINCYVDNLADVFATVDAENIRTRVKEIRIYLLAHEGQMDGSFNFQAPINPSSIRVGETGGNCTGGMLGRDFPLNGITDWQHYRWRVYTMVVNPINLR
jgi:prepilin-type N-terminal cleavage/methylation domain-containing protein